MKFGVGFIIFSLLFLSEASLGHGDNKFDDFLVFESHRAPAAFKKLKAPPSENHTLTLRIGLKNQNFEDSIDDLLYRMSDLTHPSFLPHLTDEEIDNLTKPDSEAIEAIMEWLKSHNFLKDDVEFSRNQDWITLKKVPIKKVEGMLQTKYSVYQHAEGDHMVRTESYSLPKHLHKHIELIQPTTMFGRLNVQRSSVRVIEDLPEKVRQDIANPDVINDCSNPNSVTNDCLRQLYKTEGYKVKASKKNAIGVTGYLGEAANRADAKKFMAAQRPDQVNRTFHVVSVHGGKNPQTLDDDQLARQIGVEANLDTQTVLGMTSPTPNIFYTTGGKPPFNPDITSPYNTNEPYLDWLTYILAQPDSKIPKVISTSYGDDEQTVPLSYAKKVCNGFAQLGMRGVSVIFSSGDFGVGQDGFCWANDGSNQTVFLPIFPASCPYVTSVGATENFAPEVAVSLDGPGGFYSGGGFSNYFKRPYWQKKEVHKYLKHLGNETYSGMFNKTGRGFPDVAAQGAKYAIAWQGSFLTVGGTSASAPTFASIVALLNDYSISSGGVALGYLNPWLYKFGKDGLNDITSGRSGGCDTDGFPATTGWDPVTGLGTPDFKKLQALIRPWVVATARYYRKSKKHHQNRENYRI